ncbi:MAG TPA: hypothetical protein VG268_11435 [Streptosporangiaceae bacterium]|nr:hypothetical protein [Streptosporangiaceae bacterium]
MTSPGTTEDLLRELAPQVLAALLRRYGYGQFSLCEDAAQDALLAAAVQWPADGQPGSPAAGWSPSRPAGCSTRCAASSHAASARNGTRSPHRSPSC